MPEKITTLLVENNPLDQKAFKSFVARKKLPYDYTIASSLSEAIQALKEKRFDIVLSDYLLGDGTALDVIPYIAEMPLIVIAGSGDEKTVVKAMKAGAYDYLTKYSQGNYLTTLPAIVQKAIEHKRIKTELKQYQKHLEELVEARTSELTKANASLTAEIAERAQVEEALKESEIKLQSIISCSQDAIGVSKQGVHTFVNPAYVSMFGYESDDELIGVPIIDLIAPESREMVLKNVQDRARGLPAPTDYEAIALRKNGSTFIMDVRLSTYQLQGEQYTLVILRDITERKQVEKLIRQSEEQLRKSFEHSPLAYQSLDINGLYVDINPTWCNMMGYSRDKVIGKSFADFLTPDGVELMKQRLPQFIEKGFIKNVEFEMIRKDGSRFEIELNGRIGYDKDDNFQQTHCILYDVSERKRAEEKFKAQLEELQRWHSVTLDREDRVQELKREVNQLLVRLGEPIRYPSEEKEKKE